MGFADTQGPICIATLVMTLAPPYVRNRVRKWRRLAAFSAVLVTLCAPCDPAAQPATSATLDGADGWRTLARPSSGTYADLVGDFWTQGFPGSDAPGAGCTVYTYNEAAATFAEGWTCAPSHDAALPAGRGALVYVFADDDPRVAGEQGGFPKTISDPAASLLSATFMFSMAYTGDLRPASQRGWNLLGNPTGAGIDWGLTVRLGVSSTVYVHDPAYNGGDYRTYTRDGIFGFGDLVGGVIPPFQGFFVQAQSSTVALSVPTIALTSRPDVYGRRASAGAVRFAVSDTTGERSAAWVLFSESGAWGADSVDAVRLEPTASPRAVVFTTAVGGDTPLVANALPESPPASGTVEVPLGVATAGFDLGHALTLSWTDLDAVPAGVAVTLRDHVTGAEVPVREGETYTFTVRAGGSEAALRVPSTLPEADPPRFALVMSAPAVSTKAVSGVSDGLEAPAPNPVRDRTRLVYTLHEPAPVRLGVVDALGREVAVVDEGVRGPGRHTAEIDASGWSPGLYVVRLTAGREVWSRRLTVTR